MTFDVFQILIIRIILFILKPLRSVNVLIGQLTHVIAMAIIAIMVTALALSAVTRYVSGNGYDWFIELPPVLVSWLVFPLLGPLLKNAQHIKVDFLPTMISDENLHWLNLFSHVIALLASIVFFKAGFDATLLYFKLGQIMELEIEIPIWWMYLAFPVGFVILGLFSIELVLTDLKNLMHKKEKIK